MPLFQFKCDLCNFVFEKSVKAKDKYNVTCPKCEGIVEQMISKEVATGFSPSKTIPKDLDMKVGKDAEKRWEDYEKREEQKTKIRKETGIPSLMKDDEDNYTTFKMSKDGEILSEKDSISLRKEIYKDYEEIRNDPETQKVTMEKE